MITDIRTALTRKLGPIPAWAWLTALAGAVYLWRRRAGGAAAATATDTSGTDTTPPDTQDPVTLQPGESVYNPNTGQLIGTSPEQQPTPDTGGPIVIGPGEVGYDPATGRIIPGQPVAPDDSGGTDSSPPAVTSAGAAPTKKPDALARAKAAVLTGKVGPVNRQRLRRAGYSESQIKYHAGRKTSLATPDSKKKPKPKAQHKPTSPVSHPTTQKPRSRSHGTITHPTTRSKPTHAKPNPKPRPTPTPKPSAARPRPTVTQKPVQRQRPAPAHTTPRKKKK
jgi:hypothetical protein